MPFPSTAHLTAKMNDQTPNTWTAPLKQHNQSRNLHARLRRSPNMTVHMPTINFCHAATPAKTSASDNFHEISALDTFTNVAPGKKDRWHRTPGSCEDEPRLQIMYVFLRLSLANCWHFLIQGAVPQMQKRNLLYLFTCQERKAAILVWQEWQAWDPIKRKSTAHITVTCMHVNTMYMTPQNNTSERKHTPTMAFVCQRSKQCWTHANVAVCDVQLAKSTQQTMLAKWLINVSPSLVMNDLKLIPFGKRELGKEPAPTHAVYSPSTSDFCSLSPCVLCSL